ncbi:MAG TPA: hypothetical protein PLW97_09700 [Synergistaceae bacterium]|nr:hypothetical protein [Synergistaceae bacterium]HPQ37903.1 hypothetical protein [Synergistaceae bacterium]
MKKIAKGYIRFLLLFFLFFQILGTPACQGAPELSLREFAKETDAPAPLLTLLERQIPPGFPPGSYAAAYQGWEGYFSLLPPDEAASLPNPPAALRRAETRSFERALQKILEDQELFRKFRFPSLGVQALLHLRGKLLTRLESAPGAWKRSGFLEDMPWNLLLLPPGNLSMSSLSPDLPSREELLPKYRELCLREGRKLRQEGNFQKALYYYQEWLFLSPLGPSTPSLLEYCEVLLENHSFQEARELLEKLAKQRWHTLTEGEKYALRLLWERSYLPFSE